ncbi:unnamed protein product [Hermetia illucens]|uniref:Large ribosomal subunit protein uL30m n=1 Tax=Hermetia illucens TaxID=343691 RepID=A0A7R8YWL2_HERIL|nr:39S ribosomal protein L30, mitochondrial [Hermetia illucens]CAD7087470.1 unnamed protein product [Hermetia illucens]
MSARLLQIQCCFVQSVRNYGKLNKHLLFKDGKRYEGVIYYPRRPDQEDPPITPSKLLRVQRIKPMKGNTHWEKKILIDLKLDTNMNDFAIVKNIPENCERLWKVKHLVKIVPITFPYGEPTENDIDHTFLKENGECIVTKEIKIDDGRVEATRKFVDDTRKLDSETLVKDSRLKWLNPF